ncbi:hypothetical protein [Streptomyces sp. ISL-43]|uniref:hypothetical protein n=1 Tax=Streptomyces sp. ISL-43 TaxID=2819183 RepID=UPI00203645D3|nr:hypothetical protein [Streptomyces sp. ISL-43]
MTHIDPAAHIRPDWWTDDTFIQLCALEDRALPSKGLSTREEQHPTLPILKQLLGAVWWLGKTGGIGEEGPRAEDVIEALQSAEWSARLAARAARLTLSRLDGPSDDEVAEDERYCEREDPNWGPPHARLTEATFIVRLPGYSGDTVSATIQVDTEGTMTIDGNGPLAQLNTLGRLNARAAIDEIEALVERQLAPTAEPHNAGPSATGSHD